MGVLLHLTVTSWFSYLQKRRDCLISSDKDVLDLESNSLFLDNSVASFLQAWVYVFHSPAGPCHPESPLSRSRCHSEPGSYWVLRSCAISSAGSHLFLRCFLCSSVPTTLEGTFLCLLLSRPLTRISQRAGPHYTSSAFPIAPHSHPAGAMNPC